MGVRGGQVEPREGRGREAAVCGDKISHCLDPLSSFCHLCSYRGSMHVRLGGQLCESQCRSYQCTVHTFTAQEMMSFNPHTTISGDVQLNGGGGGGGGGEERSLG